MSETPGTSVRSLVTVAADATSPASASNYVGTGVSGFSKFRYLTFVATLTGATGGVLDVIVETSANGTTWYEYIHYTQKGAGSAATTTLYTPDPSSGALVSVGKNDLANTLGATMTLAAGNGAGGRWLDQLRIRYVAGSSTSAGAAQSVLVMCSDGTVVQG